MEDWLPQVLSVIAGVAIGILVSRFRKKKTSPKNKRMSSSPVRNRAKGKQLTKKNKRGR